MSPWRRRRAWAGRWALSVVFGATSLVQSALLAVGFGRAAARAAADPPFSAESLAVACDITGVPRGNESLVAGRAGVDARQESARSATASAAGAAAASVRLGVRRQGKGDEERATATAQ